jgi:hypothetical protein
MQIHEITKHQRTDEGLLDGVKDAIKSTATTAANAAKNPLSGGSFQQAQNTSAFAQANAIRQKLNAKYNLGNKAVQAPVRGANQQGELNLTQKLELAKRDPKAKQKVSQLVKAFDQEFDTGPDVQYQTNPDAAEKYAQQKTIAPIQPVQPTQSKLQQTIAAQNRQMSPQSGIKEGALAQRSQARNAPVAPVHPVQASGKKDIKQDFQLWINQHIPGLDDVDPSVQQQLDQIFQKIVSAKGNSKAVDAAFTEYATIALAASGSGQGSYGSRNTSTSSTQQPAANQLGISPDTIAKLQQLMTQNQEVVKSNTGSKTIDTLIRAVTGK